MIFPHILFFLLLGVVYCNDCRNDRIILTSEEDGSWRSFGSIAIDGSRLMIAHGNCCVYARAGDFNLPSYRRDLSKLVKGLNRLIEEIDKYKDRLDNLTIDMDISENYRNIVLLQGEIFEKRNIFLNKLKNYA